MIDFLYTKTPLAFLIQNLWRDEAFSALVSQESVRRIFSITASDFSPPLYYLVLHYWTGIFGQSELVLRSISLMFYVFMLYLVYEIMTEILKYSRLKSLFFLIIVLLNPFLSYYATEARMYMMLTFFVTLSYFALWAPYRKTYIVAITLALFTHYLAILILIAQWAPRLPAILKSATSSRSITGKITTLFAGLKPAIIPLLIFTPWLMYVLSVKSLGASQFWVIKPPLKDIIYIPFLLFTGYERIFGEYFHSGPGYTSFHARFLYLLLTIILISLISGMLSNITFRGGRHIRKVILHLKDTISPVVRMDIFLWAFFPPLFLFLFSFVTQPLFHPRYYIYSSVGFTILLVIAFNGLLTRKNIVFRVLGVALFVALLQWGSQYNKLNLKYRTKLRVSPMMSEINTLTKPGDKIYVTSELDYHLTQYYIPSKKDQIKIFGKTYEEIPQYVGKVLIPKEAITETLPHFPKKAFIINWNHYSISTQL